MIRGLRSFGGHARRSTASRTLRPSPTQRCVSGLGVPCLLSHALSVVASCSRGQSWLFGACRGLQAALVALLCGYLLLSAVIVLKLGARRLEALRIPGHVLLPGSALRLQSSHTKVSKQRVDLPPVSISCGWNMLSHAIRPVGGVMALGLITMPTSSVTVGLVIFRDFSRFFSIFCPFLFFWFILSLPH